MRLAGYRSLAAGVLVGTAAATLTFAVERLVFVAPNVLIRWLQAAAVTLLIPGLIADFFLGRSINGFPVWIAAVCNFSFWLGFVWLFGFLLRKLREQIRLLASHL